MIADEIKKLHELKDQGVISEEEFNSAKKRLLKQKIGNSDGHIFGLNEMLWATLMHLSVLAVFIIPMLGIVLPIVLWILSKDESEFANQTGKAIINWIVSFIIYFIIAAILTLIFIGFILMVALIVLSIIFIIIGAIKASHRELYRYPLSINFLSIDELKKGDE